MKFSNLRMLAILMVGVIALGGCSGSAPSDTEEKRDTEDVTLTMYAPPGMDQSRLLQGLKSIAFAYGSKNNINIEFIEPYSQFAGPYLQDEKRESQKLSVEIMSGKGPDILINPGHCLRTSDMHKVMASRVFADLDPLLDLESKEDQYFTKVLDSGKYEGEQLIVPLFFSIKCFVSTRNVLEKNHFDINQCGTYRGFLSELNNCLDSAAAPPLIYEQRCQFLFLSDSICVPPVIDYNNRSADFSQPEVRETFAFTKKLIDQYPLSPYGENYRTPEADDGAGLLKSGKALFLAESESGGWGTLNWLYSLNPWIEDGDQLVMTALRRVSDDSVITYDQFSIAVNRNSRNVEEAAEWIEYLLSDTVQCNYFKDWLPVYRQGVEARIQTLWAQRDLPEPILDGYRSLVNDVGEMQFNWQFPATMYEMMEPYYLGKESYDSCISNVQNRFSIFVDE